MTNTQINQWLFNARTVPVGEAPDPKRDNSAYGRPVEHDGISYSSITGCAAALGVSDTMVHRMISAGEVQRLDLA